MMMLIGLSLAGLLFGLVLTMWAMDQLMKVPATRIWLSDWINWSNNKLPEGGYQVVRHGKWIADPNDGEET